MNDEMRKALTEYLGECWIDTSGEVRKWMPPVNRTFDTWDDLGALKDKLVEKGDWREFLFYCADVSPVDPQKSVSWFDWLLNPTRFCSLVGEWLGQQEGGKK